LRGIRKLLRSRGQRQLRKEGTPTKTPMTRTQVGAAEVQSKTHVRLRETTLNVTREERLTVMVRHRALASLEVTSSERQACHL